MRLWHSMLWCGSVALGCAARPVPDPKEAVAEYRAALERGDAARLHGLLSAEARAELTQDEVRALLQESKAELAARSKALSQPSAQTRTVARVRYPDGEWATLDMEQGVFRLRSAAALPAGARTPAEALAELRRALSRRSYPALVRVLSAESRGGLEEQLSSLVLALEQPDALDIQADGDRATVNTPGGHRIELVREDGVWRVRDFE